MINKRNLQIRVATKLPEGYPELRRSDWNANASFWTTYMDVDDSRRNVLQTIANRIKELSGKTPSRILDLGFGEGMFLRFCHNLFPEAELYGIDFSTRMREIAGERSVVTPVSLVQGDFEDRGLNIKPGSFDLVTSIFAFDEASDIASAFHNVRKLLARRGVAVIVILDPLMETIRYGSLVSNEVATQPSMLFVSKHFTARSQISPSPYHRIVRPLEDYVTAGRTNGLALTYSERLPISSSYQSGVIGPMAVMLHFKKG
jgi:ubiquinone/menaquinone biosynthesis C-methylase UbiE